LLYKLVTLNGNQGASQMKKFQVNNVYEARSLCNYDCVFSFTVIKRTKKQVTLKDNVTGEIFRRGIFIWQDNEACRPYGSYSMAPTINA
jgi:hypothetical protein